MKELFTSVISFEYEEHSRDDKNTLLKILDIKSGDDTIFSGIDAGTTSIVGELSNMAMALIDGQYGYEIDMYDDDFDGSSIGFSKGGRILYESGNGFSKVWYIDSEQLRDAIILLLKSRAVQQKPCGRLDEILHKLQKYEDTLVDDYLPFSVALNHYSDYGRITDRLRIQWGDIFLFTESASTNILQALLNSAIDLLNNKERVEVHIDDDNFDLPHGKNTSTNYRNFDIIIRRSKRNTLLLDITIRERPWHDETILISIDEYINAINMMITRELNTLTVDKFNSIHRSYDSNITFPEATYAKFQKMMNSR